MKGSRVTLITAICLHIMLRGKDSRHPITAIWRAISGSKQIINTINDALFLSS